MTVARRITRSGRPLSIEQYLSGPPDENKTELIHGERVVAPSPSDRHQDVQADLGHVLRAWVRKESLGWVWPDLDMVLDEKEGLVYRPDLLFLARRHTDRRRQGRVFGPADLCVEILSPSDRPRLLRRKYADYARFGVNWYWILNPDEKEPVIEENERVGEEYQVHLEIVGEGWFEPALFPGLQISMAKLISGDWKAAVRGKGKRFL
jgi:Uma2 family endonuclease